MSFSKRSLIFAFAILTTFCFFVHGRQAIGQKLRGLDMPDVYYLTQKPYEPTVELKGDEKRAFALRVRQSK
ncbi:hypothetical protein N9Y42_10005 [Mariniblastus sp.]|nr:hypothetical protein [Mariniblastus sp.]